MASDSMIGDGGNRTIYERPDGSRYALDKKGRGEEHHADDPIFGRARFDARELASGEWPGSRSTPQRPADLESEARRARRHHAG